MSKFSNAQVLIRWAASKVEAETNDVVSELGTQIYALTRGEVLGSDVSQVCRRLVSLAPQFDGKLFDGVNIASAMRSAARELRYAFAVPA